MKQEVSQQQYIKNFVQKWMNGHEPDTFVKNKHGQVMFTNGATTINLTLFFEEILSDFSESLQPNIVGEGVQKVDVEKLADDYLKSQQEIPLGIEIPEKLIRIYKAGFEKNQALQSQVGEGEKVICVKDILNYLDTNEDRDFNLINTARLTEWIQAKGITLPIQPLQNGYTENEIQEIANKEYPYKDSYVGQRAIQDARRLAFINGLKYAPLQNGRGYTKSHMEDSFFHIPQEPRSTTQGKKEFKKYIQSLAPASTEHEIEVVQQRTAKEDWKALAQERMKEILLLKKKPVEFAEWVQKNGIDLDFQYERNHTIPELYTLFQSGHQPIK